ncbi:MAG: CBS domain-containing protein [Acetobacteraceae bacterium]|nr:CBS domain-containing protein [Acetobacteraceae bacterium]
MTIGRILKSKGSDTISARPDDTAEQVAKLLAAHNIGAVLVRSADDAILGILSERDIVWAIGRHGEAALKLTASALMSRNMVNCTPDDSVAQVMAVMTNRRVRHLPVIKDGALVGIISIGDVVKERIGQAELEAEHLRAFVAGQA